MKKPVLDGELAPNIAIQIRLRIMQYQDEVDMSEMEYLNYPIEENFQSYYGWVGALANKMSSVPVFKKHKTKDDKEIYDILKDWKKVKNSLSKKEVPINSFVRTQYLKEQLYEIISLSPIYDFEFSQEETVVLSGD